MKPSPVEIIGSYLSPYVRKVLVCLGIKGIPYHIDPIVPYFGNADFERLSPLRRIPVLIHEDIAIADSSVICEYLEERFPDPPLMPKAPGLRARARWLEEFADSRMGEVFIWHFYNQLIIRKYVWGEPPDEAILKRAREEEIPDVLRYLEAQVPATGFLFDEISIADISLASFFRNAAFAHYSIDGDRWPKAAAYVSRVLGHPGFQTLIPFEEIILRTPVLEHRSALAAAGAPVTRDTRATTTPRTGVLSV